VEICQDLPGVKRYETLSGGNTLSPKEVKNIAASVHEQLLNLSRKRKETFEYVLTRYGIERLLYRLSQSEFKDSFILKGAMLFSAWVDKPYRPTKDIDMLGLGKFSSEKLHEVFRSLCEVNVEPDGLIFDPESMSIEEIRETEAYGGLRVKISAGLGRAQTTVRIDIGFGDAITPEAETILLRTLLDMPQPEIRAYPKETLIAEKLHTMVVHGIMNSRVRDYYDLWYMARTFPFNGILLSRAIKNTFERRSTEIPDGIPSGLSDEYIESHETSWLGFLNKSNLENADLHLKEVVDLLNIFLIPSLKAAASGKEFVKVWTGDEWQRVESDYNGKDEHNL
jgi:predicted nucleotidyltransferase component of viral defense system